jgi:hypothetical protein
MAQAVTGAAGSGTVMQAFVQSWAHSVQPMHISSSIVTL